jgi:dTDP-glucose pyrophosphorylase
MIFKEKNWKSIVLDKSKKIKFAIKCLNKTGLQIILVKKNNLFFGTLTDGDIRRGLVKGVSLNDSIDKITFQNPIIAGRHENLLTIKNLMEVNSIKSLPIVDEKKKICGLYLNNLKSIKINKPLVVFMAGGKGTRLLPLTKNTPKGMLKIYGKPMMEIILKKFLSEGFLEFIFSVNYQSKKIQNYFKDGKKWGAKIKYFKESFFLGTIGSLYYLKKFIKNDFIVINCDVITNVKIMDIFLYHTNNQADATIGTRVVETKSSFGHIKTNGFEIIDFIEKPLEKKFINAGIYIFSKKVFNYFKKNKKKDINELIKSMLEDKKKLIIYPIHEKWNDIGRHKDFKKYKK